MSDMGALAQWMAFLVILIVKDWCKRQILA